MFGFSERNHRSHHGPQRTCADFRLSLMTERGWMLPPDSLLYPNQPFAAIDKAWVSMHQMASNNGEAGTIRFANRSGRWACWTRKTAGWTVLWHNNNGPQKTCLPSSPCTWNHQIQWCQTSGKQNMVLTFHAQTSRTHFAPLNQLQLEEMRGFSGQDVGQLLTNTTKLLKNVVSQ